MTPVVPGGRLVAAGLAVLLLLAGCTRDSPTVEARPGGQSPSTAPVSRDPAASDGAVGPSAARAVERLCPKRKLSGSDAPAEGSAPPIVSTIERRIEGLRRLEFTSRVPVDAVTHDELVRGLSQTFDAAFPARLFERRSLAWSTIGAISNGAGIRDELERFASSQVIGYYDEVSKYLVFIGTDDPTPLEQLTLVHELAHALDDQRFGLLALDDLALACDDEGFEAGLALAEGDATHVMVAYARKYLSLEEQLGIGDDAPSTAGIEPFILRLQTWPYTAGMGFVTSLVNDGGERAVDAAFRHPPVSTEQILDPSAYPNDRPVAVDVRQLAPALGDGWRDLDVQVAGAAWLSILLGLRLDESRAAAAVEGWQGGVYRAWTDGADVAVVLRTTWETSADASRFAAAMTDWIAARNGTAEVRPTGPDVTVLFASSTAVLARLLSTA